MGAARGSAGEDVRASLWLAPMLAAVVSLVVALALLGARPEPGPAWVAWAWPGDVQSAVALFQVVAGSTLAATTLTFSLTVVALQLSSQQFSPRLLREFARDRYTQTALSLLVSAFVVALTGLRGIDGDRPLPVLLVALTFLLGLGAIGGLLAFTGHIVRALRVETMMAAVQHETVKTLEEWRDEDFSALGDPLPPAGSGTLLLAQHSGFVRAVRPDRLLAVAAGRRLAVRLQVRPGDHVVRGTPLAEAWSEGGAPAHPSEELASALARSVLLGYERTLEQDPALGFRQLTDIAVKAISPAINDPVTAAHAIGYCADLLTRIEGLPLGPRCSADEDGQLRVVVPVRDFRYYLDTVCLPIRRYGRRDPIVLGALLRMLRDVAAGTRSAAHRADLARQLDLVLAEVSDELLGTAADSVRELGDRVTLALGGRLTEAYSDRSGETRSV